MTIFEACGKITPLESKTNIKLDFDVPENIRELKISYSYSPKELENTQEAINEARACLEKYGECAECAQENLPIKNLVTVSLDSPSGYRGAAHRQDSSQTHIINADSASCGFLKGAVEAGQWDIMLNVHSVSCTVDYKIKIEGEAE
ncbi:MAG: hypothetical protein ACI4IQ_07540 [Eubacterium sp.]